MNMGEEISKNFQRTCEEIAKKLQTEQPKRPAHQYTELYQWTGIYSLNRPRKNEKPNRESIWSTDVRILFSTVCYKLHISRTRARNLPPRLSTTNPVVTINGLYGSVCSFLPLFAFCLLQPMWIRFWPIENFRQYRLWVSVQTFHCDIMFFARKISSAHWFYLPKLF